LGALATKSKDLFYDCEDAFDPVLAGGGGGGREVCFLGADDREEESSILSRLMKMEEDEEEEKETIVFSGVLERKEERQSDLLCWEMVSDYLYVAKIRSRPHYPKTTGDQA
jgi:hypothetical protein